MPLANAVQWILDEALRPRLQGSEFGVQEAGAKEQPLGDGAGNSLRWPGTGRQSVFRRSCRAGGGRRHRQDAAHRRPLYDDEDGNPDAHGATRQAGSKKTCSPRETENRCAREDAAAVRRIVEQTGLFRPAEVDVAVELVQTRLAKGDASGYEFVFAEQGRSIAGYVCFGKNTLTLSSFDVYWIAVDPSRQNQGIGRKLLDEAERQIAAAGGHRIYIETSHRADYEATRGFYGRCGYTLVAVLDDFYAPGDSKATYVKVLAPHPTAE